MMEQKPTKRFQAKLDRAIAELGTNQFINVPESPGFVLVKPGTPAATERIQSGRVQFTYTKDEVGYLVASS